MKLLLICFSMVLIGCAQPTAQQIAKSSGFTEQYIQTAKFNLASYQKISQPHSTLHIYVEGDGHVTTKSGLIAQDPTPHQPLAMRLAALDHYANVIYLARPCQNSPQDLATICTDKYWTNARYSAEVIDAVNQALNQIKQQHKATDLKLYGYSGGAAIAIIVAAQRNDVSSIQTIAGNLDLLTMQNFHHSTPLSESLDPINYAAKVRHIPQRHYIGKQDTVVPASVAENFRRAADLNPEQIIALDKVGHNSGWDKYWPLLLKTYNVD